MNVADVRPGCFATYRRFSSIGGHNPAGELFIRAVAPFDGYTVNVFLDDDSEYLAHFVEMPSVSAFGESPEDAIKELETAWEGVKESYQKHGEPVPVSPARKQYSGQFNVRIDRRLHRALSIEAAKAGVSLNAIVSQKLAKTTRVAKGTDQ